MNVIASELKTDYKIDIEKNYADDQNNGSNMKDCLLNYFLKEKISFNFVVTPQIQQILDLCTNFRQKNQASSKYKKSAKMNDFI